MFPILHEVRQNSKKYIVRFGGLNLGEDYQDGDFSDTKNVSNMLYPTITQRFGRVNEGVYEKPQAVYSKDGLLMIHNSKVLYRKKDETEFAEVGTVTEGEKQIATVGKYIIIYPDKVYYDTIDNVFGNMEAEWGIWKMYVTSNSISFSPKYSSDSTPPFPFKKGDGVRVTFPYADQFEDFEKTLIVREVSSDGKYIKFDDGALPVLDSDSDPYYSIHMAKEMPDLEYICESNMRLWGVKDNTIYASKYNDPFNFQVNEKIASDSYYIDVGTEGKFTGCCQFSNYICFFKENTLHKLYGQKPSNFQIITTPIAGVQAGCEKSLKIVNNMLIYKGVNGVYAYGGGNPELISSNFGTKRFENAVAETDGERYYISMESGGEWSLLTYDVGKRTWLKEDDTHAVSMAFSEGNVHILNDTGELLKIDPDTEENMEWSVTFCPFNETMNERKIYSKFHLRLELGEKSWISVEIRRDNAPKWDTVYTTHNERARTVSIPVMPARCDSVEIRLSGKGKCILKTFIREFQEGSDV